MDDPANMVSRRWLAFREQLSCLHCGHEHWTAHVRWTPRAHWVITCKKCQRKLVDPRGFFSWQLK